MEWDAKTQALQQVYERFERDTEEFKKHALCRIGCTYCCTDVGNVDANTLEGLIIWKRVRRFPPGLKGRIKKKLAQNRVAKERHPIAPCPFLQKDGTCLIYDIRPFSCRQLYSIRECRGRGPTVHRQAVALAKRAVRDLQKLDDTGYSGHLSYILHLFDHSGFKEAYLSGGFDPSQIAEFGKTHGIIINRFVR
ncbi:MAG: YkgJ family cysteine cluster protein [Thermodesulfobacteriota bacterium]|nr:YkgJ family cysteine cluster protein [Thermodesulfobacteriota bacterium]